VALSVQAKTIWLLILGATVVAIVLVPFRFSPVVPQSIELLSVTARAQLIQHYEKPAQGLQARTDTLRRAIIARYGGTTLTQDSILGELEANAVDMLQIVGHIRDPSNATFEEKREDVGNLLGRLLRESQVIEAQIRASYLE
jgi:hypothetical protein